MKHRLCIAVCALFFPSVFAGFSGEHDFPTGIPARRLSSVSSSFTDQSLYNTSDHAGIPLGIFEYQTAGTTLHLGYRRLGMKSSETPDSGAVYNGLIAPFLRVGRPGVIFLDMYYQINPVETTRDNDRFSMPLHRFGLTLLGQIDDGRFQLGMNGRGYYGKESWTGNGNQRILMGGEQVGLFIGLKLHDAVLLNIAGNTSGFVDTLALDNSDELPQERFSWFQLPLITVALDIGMEDLPYRSDMSFTYAHNNFVYTEKPFTLEAAITGRSSGDDADPIVSDSIAWHTQHLWNIRITDVVRFDPAVQLGYMRSAFKHMKPNGDNFPINYDGAQPGFEWSLKSFRFGFGGSWWLKEITRLWLEYSYASLTLDITGEKLESYGGGMPQTSGYNRFGAGFTVNFDEIPSLGMAQNAGLYFTFGFLFMQDNYLTSPYRSAPLNHLYPLYANPGGSTNAVSGLNVAMDRYRPWETIKNRLNTLHFGFGVGASFLDRMFDTMVHAGYVKQNSTSGGDGSSRGFEFGLDLIYNKPGK